MSDLQTRRATRMRRPLARRWPLVRRRPGPDAGRPQVPTWLGPGRLEDRPLVPLPWRAAGPAR